MSNQDLSYEALTDLAERVAMGLQNRNQPLDELTQALQALTSTNSIKGYAASRMKAYINETHLTLIQSLQLALTNYQMALGQYVEGYLQVDDSHHFHLVHEDLAELQKKLQNQKGHYQDIAHELSSIASEASGIIDLNGAGSHQMKRVVTSMEDMQHTAQHLWEEWQQYEDYDPGFNQLYDLIQQTRQLIHQTLQVPRGYDYQPGSFSQLMSDCFLQAIQANSAYASNADRQKQFTKTWQNISKDYQRAQEKLAEAKAKKKAKEAGLWGLVTDVLQTVAGAVISAAGLGLAAFSGGFSLGLVALGGTMVVGGVNSAINHASMAISGQGYNLVGQLSQGVGKFYNHTLGKSLGQKGIGGFTNGLLAGAGDFVSSSAQFNVVDTAKGIYTLATNRQAQAQVGHELGTMFNQLKGGNVYVAGQATATALTFFTGGAEAKVGKLSEATNLVTKLGRAKNLLLTKGSNLLERSEGKIQQLKYLFQDNPRVAFAGASEHTSLLKREARQSEKLTQNNVQKNFNQATQETKVIKQFEPEKVTLKSGEIVYKSSDGITVANKDFLIPESGRVNWPKNDGFNLNYPINENYTIQKGKIIDRYSEKGKPDTGRFFAEDNNHVPYEDRGVPYPQETQEKHRYVVKKDINTQSIKEAYQNLPPEEQRELIDIANDWDVDINDILNGTIKEGRIGPAFDYNGLDETARQIKSSIGPNWLKALKLIEEVS